MITISNPPYNMKWKYPFFYQSQPRFDFGVPPESNANLAFIETALDWSDKAVFLLPNQVLNSNNKNEFNIRKNLINKNLVKAVITLPGGMFESTSIPTCILVFDKNKASRNISMIDLTEHVETVERKQNGQYGKSNTKRTYSKKISVLPDDVIDEVASILNGEEPKLNYCKNVEYEQIVENDYILTPRRYFDIEREKDSSRSYKDIVSDINRIIKHKNEMKITINENIAKQTGVFELAKTFKESKGINKELSESLSDVGEKLIPENIVTLSKNRVVNIELKEFDKLPELLIIFISMWSHYMTTLNDEENRLMIELKDKRINDLMR